MLVKTKGFAKSDINSDKSKMSQDLYEAFYTIQKAYNIAAKTACMRTNPDMVHQMVTRARSIHFQIRRMERDLLMVYSKQETYSEVE